MEHLVNYLNTGKESVQLSDRKAKLIRNHPFMTQFDFFDTSEDKTGSGRKSQDITKHLADTVAEDQVRVRGLVPPERS